MGRARLKSGVTRINMCMNTDVYDAMKQLAALVDKPVSQLVREACRDYVLNEVQRVRKEREDIAHATSIMGDAESGVRSGS